MVVEQIPNYLGLAGRTVVCIAGGPSLTAADCAYARKKGAYLLGVNDAYRIAELDCLYACDAAWWKTHLRAVRKRRIPRLLTHYKGNETPGTLPVDYVFGVHGVDLTAEVMNFGGNSGFQALHLAILGGAGRILLLGYDLQMEGNKRHWFGDHPGNLNKAGGYRRWVLNLHESPKPDIPIINCSRETAVRCFERMTIQEAL